MNWVEKIIKSITIVTALILGLTSCRSEDGKAVEFFPQMYRSVAYEAYAGNPNFKDSLGALKPVEGTISRGFVPYTIPNSTDGYMASKNNHSMLAKNDYNLTQGEELYTIYCISCHGENGDGQGILVQNEKILGVPSYSQTRLPDINDGSIYHVITYGKGIMGSHASQLLPKERWQVVQYVEKLRSEL